MHERRREIFAFDPFVIDVEDRQLRRGEAALALTPKAFDTLLALAERAGRVVTKEELLAAVWPGTFVEEATLTQNIYTLRKVFAASGAQEDLIETVPRRGYRFRPAVSRQWIDDPSPAGQTGPQAPGGGPVAPLGEVRALAVLPFRTLGGDRDTELLGLGLADALITRLSHLRPLTVRPTSAVLPYAGGNRSPAEIGRELRVDAVLEGTLQARGSRSRVTVQLVDVESGGSFWAERFDASTTDPFALQDSISEQAVRALRLELRDADHHRLTLRPTESAQAYQAYVRGRFFWNKRTARDLTTAISWFRRAAEIDPAYALAYAGIADSYVLLPLYTGTEPKAAFPEAIEAARQALALDDGLAEAHTSLAYSQCFYHWDWDASEAGYRRALELNPSYSNAHHWYSFFLSARGRHGEAIDFGRSALELDPLSLVINTDLGLVLYFARRLEEAIDQCQRTLELEPAFPYAHFALALASDLAGDREAARAAAERAVTLTEGANTAMLAVRGLILARAGEEGPAREVLAELARRREAEHVPSSRFALVHTGLGQVAEALAELEQACQERSRFAVFLPVWPLFDPLREEPGFQDLLHRSGLALPGTD